MAEQVLENYKSRRNCAQLIQTPAGRFVRKTFAEESSFQKELQIYELLHSKKIACARVIEAGNKTLRLSHLPGRNLVDCLQQQEQLGKPLWAVWEKLVEAAGGEIVAKMAILAEGDAIERDDIITLAPLPLFFK